MDIYSVNLPDKVSPELRERADRIEAEINSKKQRKTQMTGHDEESIFSMADASSSSKRSKVVGNDFTEEQMFGTAVPEGSKANEQKAFRSMAQNASEANDSDAVQESRVRNPSFSLKQILFQSLGATSTLQEEARGSTAAASHPEMLLMRPSQEEDQLMR